MRELVAPIKVFPISFIMFSIVYIVAAVALSHTATTTHWVNVAMFMYMAMAMRGIVFFIVYFWLGGRMHDFCCLWPSLPHVGPQVPIDARAVATKQLLCPFPPATHCAPNRLQGPLPAGRS